MNPFIYLASQSPRRQDLLKQIGVHFELLQPQIGEDTESIEIALPQEKARVYVERVTLAKSAMALTRWEKSGLPWAPILCADTTVSLPNGIGGEILGKPTDAADATRILEMLSDKTHEVLTAVAVRIDPEMAPSVWYKFQKSNLPNSPPSKLKTTLLAVNPSARRELTASKDEPVPSFPRSKVAIAVSWVYPFMKPPIY